MENNEELELEEEYEEYEDEGGASGLSLGLNSYFHHLDRGGSLGGEILAGISLFFLSICVIFMNMQLVGNVINAGVVLGTSPDDPVNIAAANVYTQLYVGAIFVAILGSLLMGLVARLPFTQVSFMGLASSLLCLVGTETGLTWQNLLFINLVAGVLYTVICAVKPVRRRLVEAIPQAVRKALPAALGLMVAWVALQLSGIVTAGKIPLWGSQSITVPNGLGLTGLRKLEGQALIGVAVAVVLFVVLCIFKRKHKVFWSLMGGTVVFAGVAVLLNGIDTANTESFINFGRIWLIAGSQASQITPFADSYLTYAMDAISGVLGNLGQVITKGADFSGYTGNTLVLVISGVLTYLFAGLFGTLGALEEEESSKALLCSAITNVAAPFFGVAGVTPGVSSVGAVRDNGRSGITALVACIGFIISLFVMAFPALFGTVTYPVGSMNEWNYFAYGNGGIVYLIQGIGFAIVDVVIACAGVSMAKGLLKLNWKDISQWIPAIVTVLAALLTANLVIAVALGSLVALPLAAIRDKKVPPVGQLVLTALLLVTVVLL